MQVKFVNNKIFIKGCEFNRIGLMINGEVQFYSSLSHNQSGDAFYRFKAMEETLKEIEYLYKLNHEQKKT